MTPSDFTYQFPGAALWAVAGLALGLPLLLTVHMRLAPKESRRTWVTTLADAFGLLVVVVLGAAFVLFITGKNFQAEKDEATVEKVVDAYGLFLNRPDVTKISGAIRSASDDDVAVKVTARVDNKKVRVIALVESGEVVFRDLAGSKVWRSN